MFIRQFEMERGECAGNLRVGHFARCGMQKETYQNTSTTVRFRKAPAQLGYYLATCDRGIHCHAAESPGGQ